MNRRDLLVLSLRLGGLWGVGDLGIMLLPTPTRHDTEPVFRGYDSVPTDPSDGLNYKVLSVKANAEQQQFLDIRKQAALLNTPLLAQLAAVQDHVNRCPYVQENPPFNVWTPPDVFMAKGGDCKGYSLAKMWLCLQLGISPHVLFLTSVATPSLNHCVLLVQRATGFVMLDSVVELPVQLTDTMQEGYRLYLIENQDGAWAYRFNSEGRGAHIVR